MFLTLILPRFVTLTIMHIRKLVMLAFYVTQEKLYLYACKIYSIQGRKNKKLMRIFLVQGTQQEFSKISLHIFLSYTTKHGTSARLVY